MLWREGLKGSINIQSPGKILNIKIPTFEALTQFGTASIIVKNVGKLEASYGLTFDCAKGISFMEEQFFIMKPEEVVTRSFYLYPRTDQAAKYECTAILKASDFNEVDRAECQFTTTATILDNGSQIIPAYEPDKNSINGVFKAIGNMWHKLWDGVVDFFIGKTCRYKCSSFFDFRCHIQYICMSWILMFGLLLAIFPTVIVLLWLLHQKGFFDPLYDWWDDRFILSSSQRSKTYAKHGIHAKDDEHVARKYHLDVKRKRKSSHHSHRVLHRNQYPDVNQHELDHHHHLHVHKERPKHRHGKGIVNAHDSCKVIKHHGEKKHTRHTHDHNRIHEAHPGYNSDEN